MANLIFMKLYQNPNFDSMQSPNDIFKMILLQLNEWLSIIPNLFHSLVAKFDEAFPPETREQWLAALVNHYMLVGFGVVFLYLWCWCCLPPILGCITWILAPIFGCITWILAGVWSLIRGHIMYLWGLCVRVFRCFCCCRKRSMKMMKAPGRGGRVMMPRAVFENDPRNYFSSLRAHSRSLV